MSLYRYVASKEELLALMVDAALGGRRAPQTPAARTGARARRWAWATVAAMRAHPWAATSRSRGPPLGPERRGLVGGCAGARCARRGLAEAEKASIVLMLSRLCPQPGDRAWARSQAHFLDAAGTPHDAMRGYRDTLRGLADAERFPALHALLDAGVFDRADPPDEEFAFGLERILDGVEALVRAQGAGPSGERPRSRPRPCRPGSAKTTSCPARRLTLSTSRGRR